MVCCCFFPLLYSQNVTGCFVRALFFACPVVGWWVFPSRRAALWAWYVRGCVLRVIWLA